MGLSNLQQIPTSKTLFSLVFGIEVVIPLELGLPSFQVEDFWEDSNFEHLEANLDLVIEV